MKENRNGKTTRLSDTKERRYERERRKKNSSDWILLKESHPFLCHSCLSFSSSGNKQEGKSEKGMERFLFHFFSDLLKKTAGTMDFSARAKC